MRNKNKLYNNFIGQVIIYLSIPVFIVLPLAGCGKKAPPVPPRQAKLSTINALDTRTVGSAHKITKGFARKKRSFELTLI